jgi:hypothetical protein
MNAGAGAGDDLEGTRAAFEAKVRRTYAARSAPTPGGKGSPAALLAIGVLGTGLLAVVAGLLGAGLLYVPAAIPLVTVLAVLSARGFAARGAADPPGRC